MSEESKPTFVAEVINHDYLSQVPSGGPLNYTVDGSHQCRPAFIMEDYHHTGGQQSVIIVPVLTPAEVGQDVLSTLHRFIQKGYTFPSKLLLLFLDCNMLLGINNKN